MKKWSIRSSGRAFFLCLVALAAVALGQGQARADEITISGSTTGTVTGVPQLTFTGNPNFTGMTSLNIGSLSGVNSLGTFTLSTAPAAMVGGSFTLNVAFTQPGGIDGGQATTFTAAITGSVSPNVDQGGVLVNFDDNPVLFTFNDGTNSGSFTMQIIDVRVQSGRTADLTAGITGSQSTIPEPATMLLFGTGVAGVAAKLRRRDQAGRRSRS